MRIGFIGRPGVGPSSKRRVQQMHVTRIIVTALALAAGLSVGTGSIAASAMTAKPAATKPAAPTSTLFCQIGKSDSKVTVQVVNAGSKDVAAGTVFAYTILGPKTKTAGSYKLAWALGPKKSINLTKPMAAASVTSCTPAVKS